MEGEEREGPPELRAAEGRPAGAWCWPVIALSVFFVGWSVNLFQPRLAEAEEKVPEAPADPGDLAIFQIQAQMLIAVSSLKPEDAADTLEEMESHASNDRMRVALALLESFVSVPGREPGDTLRKLSEDAPAELRALAEKAVRSGIDEGEREELAVEVGWFAKLARSPGLESPPESGAVRAKAIGIGLVGGLLFLGAGLAIIVGAVLLILKLRQQQEDPGTFAFDSATAPQGVMLESFALYLAMMAGGELLATVIHPLFSISGYVLGVTVPFLWPILRGVRWSMFRRSLGFHRGSGVWREIGAGAVGYLGVMSIASIGIFLTILLSLVVGALQAGPGELDSAAGAVPATPQTHPIVGWIFEGGWSERFFLLLLAAGFAPLFEEIFFRGALHRYLRGKFRFLPAAVLTGVVFAALHPQGWMGIPALAAIGIGFSLLREWRDSLIAPMVAHAINNGVLVTMLSLAL